MSMSNQKVMISFRLSPNLAEWIRRMAAREGRTVSQFVMRLVESQRKAKV